MTGITSLEDRRIRGDMIEVYKLLTGKEKIDYKQFFNFTNSGVTMGWLLRLVTGGPTGKGAPDSPRVLND